MFVLYLPITDSLEDMLARERPHRAVLKGEGGIRTLRKLSSAVWYE